MRLMEKEKGIAHLALVLLLVAGMGLILVTQLGNIDSAFAQGNSGNSNGQGPAKLQSAMGDSDDYEGDDDYMGPGNSQGRAVGAVKRVFGDDAKTVRLNKKQGMTILEIEDDSEDGDMGEADEEETDEFLDELEDDTGVDLDTETDDNEVIITRNGTRTRTNFPLTIGPNNELIVSTPAGVKIVTILPDQAVRNMLFKAGFTQVDLLPGQTPLPTVTASAAPTGSPVASGLPEPTISPEPTTSGEPTSSPEASPAPEESEIILTEVDGELSYEIEGEKEENFLGLVPVKIRGVVYVSAEDGSIVKINKGIGSRILDALSF